MVGYLMMTFGLSAAAQTETGQIIGKVTDPNGAVVAGATVTVKSVDKGAERTTTTGDDGFYTVTNLQPGLYDVTVNGTGFAPAMLRAQVTVGAKTSLETTLSVSAISGNVVDVVAGNGVEVNTQNQELADAISGTQIRELPTLTRNPYNLVGLSGNATQDPGDAVGGGGRGAGYNLNGQRTASTNILLDGADNNNTFSASIGQRVPLDSVGEFRVITSNFSAEYGRASGGVVNVATRAGSNDFHGSVYEFNRISRLASNGFDNNANGIPRSRFARNQFGYAFGGPVLKNKIFFFSSTEWTRVRSTGGINAFVPTPELIGASSPATQQFFNAYKLAGTPTGRALTVADVIADRGGAAAGFVLATNAFAALSPTLPALQEIRYTIPADFGGGIPQNTYQTVNRGDWNLSDRTQIYGRYAVEKNLYFQGTNASSPYSGFDTGVTNFRQNALLSLTHSFTPNFVSQSKIVYNRLNDLQGLGEQPAGPTVYLKLSATAIGGTALAFPGYLPFSPGSALPSGGPQNLGQVYQDLSYTAGKHLFRFGGQYVYIRDNHSFGAFQNSVEELGANTAQGFSNLVLGQLFRFQSAVDPQGKFPGQTINLPVSAPSFDRSNRYNEYALYFNDAWRVKQNVTLNLGVRYEFYGVQHNKDQNLDANFYYGSGSTIQERIRNGSVQRAPDSGVGGLWKPDKNNFAPRVGLAWDIFGDGTTSLRGGYGLAYERNFGNVTFNVIQNPPSYAVIALTAGADIPVGSLPLTLNNSGPLAGTTPPTKALPGTSLRHVSEDVVNAYAHFWSAAFERQIVSGTVASVEYTGSAGRKLYTLENINRPGFGALYLGDTNPNARLNTQYTDINSRSNSGYSNYGALIFGIDTNNFRNYGLQLTARYTYAVAKDNLSATFGYTDAAKTVNLGLLDPFNPKLDYGYADFDTRHRLTTGFNWELPIARDTNNFIIKQLIGGWSFSGLALAATGTPFSIFDCTGGRFGQYCPRLVPTGTLDGINKNPSPVEGAVNRFNYLDLGNQTPGSYQSPINGLGYLPPFPDNMTRRNQFRGPGNWNVDAALFKRFRFSEKYSLQLRGEVFNIFNHGNLYIAGYENEVNSGFVGVARGLRSDTATQERRNIQLALKFIF